MLLDPDHQGVMFYYTRLRDPSREEEFHRWYVERHIPDVMVTPGILGYHRFVDARDRDPDERYLILCDVDDPDVDEVQRRMNANFPSPEDKEERRRWIEQGRLTTFARSTWNANFRRIL